LSGKENCPRLAASQKIALDLEERKKRKRGRGEKKRD
jgi:hypothetical protein